MNTKPPHKSNTSSYQLMYIGPHSKQRKSLQINSQSTLEWNVSHWDRSPGQSFPAFRLPITLRTRVQTHARQALRSRRGGQGRQHRRLCGRVYRFNKALGISWIARAKSVFGVLPKLEFFRRFSVIRVYKFFFFFLSFLPEWGDGPIVKTIVGESELCVNPNAMSVFTFGEMG